MGTEKKGWVTTKKERTSYIFGIGSVYGQYALLSGATLSTFLMMSGMDMGTVAVVLLIVKCLDAFDDLVIGFIVDKINPHNHPKLKKIVGKGQYMPWMRLCTFTLPVSGILLYLMPKDFNEILKIIWLFIFYLAVDITYTLVDVPGNALITTITPVIEERNAILGVKIFPMMLFALAGGIIPNILYSEKVGIPMGISVALVTLLMSLFAVPMLKNVKEHNACEKSEEENYTVKEMLIYLKKNKYLTIFYIGLIIRLVTGTGAALGLFVSFYLFHSSLFSLVYTAAGLLPVIIITVMTPWILKKFDSGAVLKAVSIFGIFSALALFIAGYENPVLHVIIFVVNVIPGTFMTVVVGFICPNIVEYGKYKSGIDGTGIAFAVNSFSIKVGGAIASSLGIALLGLFGWINVQAESFAELAAMNVTQTEAALHGLWLINAGVPLIGNIICTILWVTSYRLKDKDVRIMIQCNEGNITKEEAQAQMSRQY